ncbi:hypothetical protein PM082_004455 [Marasmius tenuissimus]|nr:hypothetical protein PM082_004455 [Marasmius tenuissimus]
MCTGSLYSKDRVKAMREFMWGLLGGSCGCGYVWESLWGFQLGVGEARDGLYSSGSDRVELGDEIITHANHDRACFPVPPDTLDALENIFFCINGMDVHEVFHLWNKSRHSDGSISFSFSP